ncbi:hypothetical protein [uncultured Alistipes sp.]|uniref:hypothetical protein n=1 Tax=uncultured Alistipes sp. TaxID=538949 RepID=UPI00266F7491|nr:hypothetical protein [uncultured Alistipes sp.]
MTEAPYTIGFLGGFRDYRHNSDFIDNALDHYSARNARLRVLVSPTTEGETRLATRILAARKTYPGIEIISVIATAHMRSYQNPGTGSTVVHRNRIIAASNYYIVVPEKTIGNYMEQLYNLFIAHCDLILYNNRGIHKTDPFLTHVKKLGVPVPIAFLPKFTADTTDIEKVLNASLAYLRANAFRIRAEKLPQVFLRSWMSQSGQERYAHISSLDDVAAVFRLDDKNIRLKVFAYALAIHANFWADPECCDADSVHVLYRLFCRQLDRIALARASGQPPERFELFDFDKQLKDVHRQSRVVVRP